MTTLQILNYKTRVNVSIVVPGINSLRTLIDVPSGYIEAPDINQQLVIEERV